MPCWIAMRIASSISFVLSVPWRHQPPIIPVCHKSLRHPPTTVQLGRRGFHAFGNRDSLLSRCPAGKLQWTPE